MRKLISLLSIFAIVLSCSSDETSTPVTISKPETPPTPPEPTPVVQYNLNATSSEGGSVDGGGVYNDGQEVTIVAIPEVGYVFNGWSNGSFNNPLVLKVDSEINIESSFIKITQYFESHFCDTSQLMVESSPNKTTDNFNKQFRPFFDYNSFIDREQYSFTFIQSNGNVGLNPDPNEANHFHSSIFQRFININNNNIPDFILVGGEHRKEAFGEVYVIIDNVLTHRFSSGQSGTRRLLIGDIDENGSEDLVIVGTGIDQQPYSGGVTKIVYFTPSSYEIVNLDDDPSYYHSGAIGDVNNDGNLDILVINNQGPEDTFIYLGDGNKSFDKKSVGNQEFFANRFNSKFYDINNDQKLDLISGGHEWDNDSEGWNPQYRTEIYLGNGDGSFEFENPIKLPEIDYWGIVNDFLFHDLDGDGEVEIIINRTKGHEDYNIVDNDKGYDGLKIQILKRQGDEYINHQILDQPEGWFDLPPTWIEWVPFIQLFDVNGDCVLDIVPDSEGLSNPNYSELSRFWGLYYRGQSSGNFVLDYFNPSNPNE